MTTHRRGSLPATAARRWRRCSSMSRAVAAKLRVRPPNEPAVLIRADRAASRRRHGAALSPALVMVAGLGADLLAGGAAPGVGLPAVLHRAEFRLLRTRRRRLHRLRDDVGHPVPRSARLLDLVSGRDVVAQPRQPDDQPV